MTRSLISGCAIGVKRLHDRNRSGWWILLFYFAPSVLDPIGRLADSDLVSFPLSLAGLVVAVWGSWNGVSCVGPSARTSTAPIRSSRPKVPATR